MIVKRVNFKKLDLSNAQKRVMFQRISTTLFAGYYDRIFRQTKDTSGNQISIKVPTVTPRKGAYSKAYANQKLKRAANNRIISKVTLDATGDTKNNMSFDFSVRSATIGFITSQHKGGESFDDITTHLEALYGEIFTLTKAEEAKVDAIVDNYLDEVINGI